MKRFHIILLLVALSVNLAVYSNNITYTPSSVIEFKSQRAFSCLTIELYDSDMEPKHLQALRLVRSGADDISPDKILVLLFTDGQQVELTPLPGQMWSSVPFVWRDKQTKMELRSMCYSMSADAYNKIMSSPLEKIILNTVNPRNGKQKTEEIKIKSKNANSLLETLQQEKQIIEQRHSEQMSKWIQSTGDFEKKF